ncbi:hypothetical protein PoB_007207100 [Plakobranchus ocellatus]|uniref:Uncharacterized protein n=1 Tax=Plakobranchus ocellatus TaxID=259542 RepID=A0AAV4DNR4_9GAST|nr:hypothetical protein PoB_007207100 [Plakobranchus ocellatus]
MASPQQGDLRLSGQGGSGGARARDRRVLADLMADSLATVPPTPPHQTKRPDNVMRAVPKLWRSDPPGSALPYLSHCTPTPLVKTSAVLYPSGLARFSTNHWRRDSNLHLCKVNTELSARSDTLTPPKPL